MHRILSKIADWLIEKEENEAEKCDIPDEIIDEWLEILRARKKILKEEAPHSEEYKMVKELLRKVEYIKELRKKKCKIK